MKSRELRVAGGEALRQRMVRRERQERGAEQRVGPGREDFDRLAVAPGESPKSTRAPSERPIQFSCISRTRSGQRSSVLSAVEQIVG